MATAKKKNTAKSKARSSSRTVKAKTAKTVAKKATVKKARKSPSKKTTARKTVAAKKPGVKKTAKSVAQKPATKRSPIPQPVAAQMPPETQRFIEQALSITTPNAMEKTMTQSTKQFEKLAQDAGDMGRNSVEAFIKSGTIFAKGFEDLFRESVSFAQSSAEKQSELMKKAMSAKTLNEWTDIQNKVAQQSFNEFMAGATKISEMSVKLLNEASEPINEQVAKTMKKASKAAAA